jgi:hypothetical protein
LDKQLFGLLPHSTQSQMELNVVSYLQQWEFLDMEMLPDLDKHLINTTTFFPLCKVAMNKV